MILVKQRTLSLVLCSISPYTRIHAREEEVERKKNWSPNLLSELWKTVVARHHSSSGRRFFIRFFCVLCCCFISRHSRFFSINSMHSGLFIISISFVNTSTDTNAFKQWATSIERRTYGAYLAIIRVFALVYRMNSSLIMCVFCVSSTEYRDQTTLDNFLFFFFLFLYLLSLLLNILMACITFEISLY